ncbi:MAG: MFS transporter [Armatimonadota bacterium]
MTNVATQAMQPQDEGGFLALMRHRNYALIWGGQLVSHLGDRFQWVAISLWVYAQTGSALSVSYAITALMVAPALVGLYAGALVDRVDRRRIMVVTDLARAALVSAIPWLMTQGLIWVYMDLFLVSAASAFFRPAMFAAIPQSVPKERLLQANAFFASLESAVEVVGPALAGLLIAQLQYAAALYIDAASYVVSALFVGALRLSTSAAAGGPKPPKPAQGTLQSIQEGLRYIRSDKIHVALLAMLFAGQWVVGLSSLQTPLAKGVLGITDRQFGWFQSIWGMGFVAASLLLGWYGRRIARGQAIVFGYLLWALSAGMVGLSMNFSMLVVAGFWVGFSNIVVFVNVGTVIMEHTPADRIGRAIAVRQIGVSLVRVVALLGFGSLGDRIGVRPSILAMAGLSLMGAVAAAIRYPTLLRYRADEPSTAIKRDTQPARRLGEPMLSWVMSRLIGARVEPEFIVAEQRWLNGASLLIVGLGWFLLLTALPIPALGLAGTVAAAVGLAAFVRWVGRRLKIHSPR